MVIEKAKKASMPMSNIERSIARVKDKSTAELEEIMYEGYGPGGVAVLVECATDNKNRTLPEVRSAFSKNGGRMADAGSVAFQFSKKGVIRVMGIGEEIQLQAIEAGAEDVFEEPETGETVIYTAQNELGKVRDALKAAGADALDAELTYVPNNNVEVDNPETARKVVNLMDALEDLEDVTNTHTNFEITEGVAV